MWEAFGTILEWGFAPNKNANSALEQHLSLVTAIRNRPPKGESRSNGAGFQRRLLQNGFGRACPKLDLGERIRQVSSLILYRSTKFASAAWP